MKVLQSLWFSNSRGLVGIARVETEFDGIKYYISSVKNSSTQEIDSREVAEWGSSFPKEAGDVLFGVQK